VNAAVCADAAALRASLDKLAHVSVRKGAVSEIKAGLKDVQANLTALVNDARGQWQAQTDALKSALAKLQTAVKNPDCELQHQRGVRRGDRDRRRQHGRAEAPGHGEHALPLRIPDTQRVSISPPVGRPAADVT
jgi:hypothetical protein